MKIADNMTDKNHSKRLSVSIFAIFLLFLQVGKAQDYTMADQFLQKNMKALGGELAVIVQKDGKPIYKKVLGKEFLISSSAPAEELTQWFTAVAVLQQHEEGKFNLDDPAAKYIHKFEQYMKGYITVRHGLTHTTGLDGKEAGVGKFIPKGFSSLSEEVDTYISKRDIVANPGEAFAYNRIGLSIAAKVAEIASKKTFDRLATDKVFRPLGMRQTMYINDNGYINTFNGATTSAQDCMNFLQMLLNKGTLNGKKVLSEESVKELFKPQFTDDRIVSKPSEYKESDYTLTTWVMDKDDNGNATVLRQGLGGTQAVVDFKNNTAILVFLKDPGGDKKKQLVNELINILQGQ